MVAVSCMSDCPCTLGRGDITDAHLHYAALSDVEKKTKQEERESFFFAEALKYLYLLYYLLYAPPETVDLSKVVFNTDAHPIRRTW